MVRELIPLAFLLATGQLGGASLSKAEAADGWIRLFDDQTLFGWTVKGKAQWHVQNGVLRTDGAETGYIRTNSQFGDFLLRLDYRTGGDVAVYLRVPSGESLDGGYEIRPGRKDAAAKWRRLDIEAKGDHVRVLVDGQPIEPGGTPSKSGGFIALGSRGGAAEFRDIRLKPLGLEPLYNGSNMDGWKLVAPPGADKKGGRKLLKVIPLPSSKPDIAEWSVRNGAIHVEKGKGQLETAAVYDNFVLQMEVRSNGAGGRHPTAGVLLRGEPGKPGSGYEVRIDNHFRGKERQPVDFGTGGIPPFQKARKIVSEERQFFTQTIAASGRHLSVWIDGELVTDYEDRRPAGGNVAKEARLGKGPIALRAVEETNADFRNIRIRALGAGGNVETAQSGTETGPPPVSGAAPPPAAPGGGVIPPTPPVATGSGNPPGPEALASQQLAQEQQQQQQVSQLMQQGLAAPTPEEQVRIYSRILAIDPGNQVAYSARKEAQDKIDQRNAESAKKQQDRLQQEQNAATVQQRKQLALENAERALLSGDLITSRAEAETARRLAPNDPEAQRLLNLIDSRLQLRSRMTYLLFGTSGFGLIAIAAVFVRRRRHRRPLLEVAEGPNKGKVFDIREEVTRIGAIAQDGGNSNDVVVDDFSHSISRFHCEIHNVKGKLYLVDCGSSNGTYLDGKRLKPERPAPVSRGTRIRLGHTCTLSVVYRRRT